MDRGEGPPQPKICQTYPTIMKHGTLMSYLKKIQKFINHMTHTLSSADIIIFYQKSATFVILKNTGKDCILKHNFYFF